MMERTGARVEINPEPPVWRGVACLRRNSVCLPDNGGGRTTDRVSPQWEGKEGREEGREGTERKKRGVKRYLWTREVSQLVADSTLKYRSRGERGLAAKGWEVEMWMWMWMWMWSFFWWWWSWRAVESIESRIELLRVGQSPGGLSGSLIARGREKKGARGVWRTQLGRFVYRTGHPLPYCTVLYFSVRSWLCSGAESVGRRRDEWGREYRKNGVRVIG